MVVGGGLTGLWTAYHAKRRDPGRTVRVLEAETIGFGASSRNGGWLSDLLTGSARGYGAGRAQVLREALTATVDDVLGTLAREGIEAGQRRGGRLTVARTPAALSRLADRQRVEGGTLLSADAVRERVAVEGAVGGLHAPTTATLDPRLLVAGLADVVRGLGVVVEERRRVTAVAPGRVTLADGVVRAKRVAVCTEGYSGALLPSRALVPVNSSIVLTRPLPSSAWDAIGWEEFEALNDAAHVFVYLRRTADGRIAIGGRGSPYRYGSGFGDGSVDARTVRALVGRLREMFPGAPLSVERAWSGVIGVTRDWCATVRERDGVATAYGFAGHGVTATHLAARTMLDRLDGLDTPLTRLAWNDHDPGRWEPEPLRWAGIHGMYATFRLADAWEEAVGARRTSLLARAGSRLAGL